MMTRRFCAFCGLALLAPSLGLPAAAGAEEKPGTKDAVFEMREVSVFDNAKQLLNHGQYAACSSQPDEMVKAYPKLKSKHPIYGKLQFDRSLSNIEGTAIHFVLDESGETPTSEEEADRNDATDKTPEKARSFDANLVRYDRLYFDANRDLDLTNDPVLKPMKHSPWKSIPGYGFRGRMAFELASIDVNYGPGIGVRPFRIFPWFVISEGAAFPTMQFAATVAHKGTVKIGKDEYDALLVQEHVLTGRFDRPTTSIHLTPKNGPTRRESFGFEADLLMSMRRSGDQFYTISATPLGDKVAVNPYRGAFGVFKIGPGDRKLKEFGFQGSFRSETTAIGMGPDRASPGTAVKKMSECKLPVGDYVPSYLTVEYGGLQIAVSDNYHSEGRPRDMKRGRSYKIQIREDKPFVLDFSNKPAVLFASPATDKPGKPGDEVKVAAVLIDPVLDIMIRRLTDTSRKKKETIRYGEGKDAQKTTYDRPLSLDPLVTIANSSGKNVAEGVMPFG